MTPNFGRCFTIGLKERRRCCNTLKPKERNSDARTSDRPNTRWSGAIVVDRSKYPQQRKGGGGAGSADGGLKRRKAKIEAVVWERTLKELIGECAGARPSEIGEGGGV